jgi:hypothetical protein
MRAIIIDRIILPAAVLAALLNLRCADLSGGGSEAGNARVIGMVLNTQGSPASNVIVTIVPSDLDPVKGDLFSFFDSDTTGSEGIYELTVPKGYTYTIQAVHMTVQTRALVAGVAVMDTTVTAPRCTLSAPGAVKVMLPDSADKKLGYIYIPGTTVFAFLNNAAGFVVLDSISAGMIPAISYSSTNSFVSAVIRYNVTVASNDTAVVFNPSWKYARRLVLNTSSSGVAVSGNVVNFPVLIRLNGINFAFSQAETDGADIRFTKPDNTFLPYEVERWDHITELAEIWVRVDTVYGSDSIQSIMMYWGNPDAADGSNGAAVFDTANGFQGVWHLAEAGNTTAYDATANRYDGTPYNTAPPSAPGAIGIAREFDGVSDGIRMTGTAGGRLNFLENGYYTVSAWVYSDTLDDNWHLIVGKSNGQYYLKQQSQSRIGNWEFVEYHDMSEWQITETPMTLKTWKYLTGVREGGRQYLYLDGQLVDSTIKPNYNTASRNTSDDVSIGRYVSYVTYENEGYCFFDGKIDEVRIASVASSTDWIKLSFMNQRSGDKLVVFK